MRLEHIQRHIGEQMIIIETLSQAYDKLIRIGRENITRQRIETRVEALTNEWEKFRNNNIAIRIATNQLSSEDRRAIESTSYFKDDHYSAAEDQYLETVEKMKQFFETNLQPSAINELCLTSTPLQQPSRGYQDPRLPRINLPNFSGDYDEWLTFKELFSSMITDNQLISDSEKHHYLKCCLKGTAAQLFNTASSGECNFRQAWNAVTNFYDSRRILVSATLDSFFNIKEIKEECAKELERLYTATTQIYRTLKNLNRPVEHWDDILVHVIVRQKLDSNSIRSWEQHVGSSDEPPSWQKLQSFLISRSRTLRAIENSQGKRSSSSSYPSKKPAVRSHFTSQFQNNYNAPSENSCSLCKESHFIAKCANYLKKTPEQRNELIKNFNLCYNCLKPHRVSACRSVFRCTKCGKRHHSSLHQDKSSDRQRKSSSPTAKQVNHAHQIHANPVRKTIILLATARLRAFNSQGESIVVRALLDQGSEITLASQNLVQQLRIRRKSSSVAIVGVGAQKTGKTRGIASFVIKPYFDSITTINLEAHILPKLTSLTPSTESMRSKWPHLEGLLLADPDFTEPGDIDLILGADVYGQLLEGPIAKGPTNSPTAQLTKLGWIVSGPSQQSSEIQGAQIHHYLIDHDLHSLLEKFWHQEEITSSKSQLLSAKDKECEDHFIETHHRNNDGRYVVRLPFKKPTKSIGDSKPAAFRMLHQLFRKFETNSILFDAYSNFLTEYEQLQHMTRVYHENSKLQQAFYLPHHGVIRESSTTTKLRVVFNGSCKVSGGINLNEALHAGPKCQLDIFDILLWMRTFKYIFSADIEKMYRQILVHPEDRHHQRIFWKRNNEIVEYELATVTYGLACAPFLALRSILQLVKDEGSKYPQAVDIMLKGRYVDDIFGGADSLVEAQLRVQQVNDMCMAGGFPLRKWISNNPEILKSVQPAFKLQTEAISIKDQIVHALGLSWNPSCDIFQFTLQSSTISTMTKRSVLSRIAQFFDPLGLLSPIFIKSKIFMQELWAIKLQWDETMPIAQQQTWKSLLRSLEGLENIQIPRWLGTTSKCTIEVHGFSDSSQLAMAAVVYLRTSCEDITQTSILCSKTKVAPLKRITIPRLELSAAVLLTKLVQHCINVLNLSTAPCYLWTDSAIVHTWINNHPSRWKEFVHNRICFIQENLPHAQWRHVPGTENPADCASRGLSSKELQKHSLWWKGPTWLTAPPSSWPTLSTSPSNQSSTDLEERVSSASKVLHTTIESSGWELLHRYSSLNSLLRVTARLIKVIKKRSFKGPMSSLTPDDINSAKLFWTKTVQQQHLSSEIKNLINTKELQRSSPIIRLLPFIDDQGLLRVGGRLRNSSLPFTTQHPYILPQQSYFSTLIIRDAHYRTLHGSTQDTLSYIRNSFWILGGRRPVRSIILKCVTCTRYRRNHAQQIMGQLPANRVTPSRAFLHTGVDYAGPLDIKTWKGRSARPYKAWIALFVCLSTSAIHLEIVTDYSTEAFISAYKRFTARRGICTTLSSDCGTNFKGAEKELKNLFNQSSSELQHLSTLIAQDGTKWTFNPPAAPHFGGKWEAGVKSMKYHLKRVIGNKLLTYEELSTIITQIEAILNSRPMCPLTDDPNDLNVLTPGHFLIGHALNFIPEPNLLHIQETRLSRWQRICQMTQSFWVKWSKEYLQRQQAVYKWTKPASPLKEGSLVFVIDERYPPAKWPLGRILKVYPGNDGGTRVADIKTSSSTITRPAVKLCPINFDTPFDTCSSPESMKAGGKC